jgi:hypothetical protein
MNCSVGNLIYRAYYKRNLLKSSTHESYIKELQSRLQSSYQAARVNLESHKKRSKEYHDRNISTPLFIVGEKVLFNDEKIRRGTSSKLSPSFIGPYEITH